MCRKEVKELREKQQQLSVIQVIPQGTVDNNLGPDRLAGANALDLNYRLGIYISYIFKFTDN